MNQHDDPRPGHDPLAFLAGGGEMGRLIQSMDWSQTPLGPIESWPQSLRTTVGLCLASSFPISIAWGPKHIQIYNDGYWPICGGKHPHSMGQDFRECWASAWPAIGEAFAQALAGHGSYLENRRMFLDRNGYLEETFFTFSFSPIYDETGGVGGLFHPATETTGWMLSERRTRALRDLAARAGKAKTIEEACRLAAQTLAEYDLDLPFTLFYLLDLQGKEARLTSQTGLPPGTAASPDVVGLEAPQLSTWPLADVARTGRAEQVQNLEQRFGSLACGPYPESPKVALALPITLPGQERPIAVLVAGVSSRLELNEAYRAFYDLVAASVTTAIANARTYEEEKKRAEALAELDRAKTAFFSNVSHEFRTPLTLMLGPVEDILAKPEGGVLPENRELLQVVHRHSLRLLKLVNTLLDFSRIEAGRMQAVYQPADIAAWTSELASMFRSAVEKAGMRLVVDCSPIDAPVFLDREMWEKIVLNLLSNAFKFTFEGKIEVRLRQAGEAAELTVRDTGVGIPAADLPHIFERFHRVEGAKRRSHEGTGIGMALVYELTKLHGGSVRVESVEGQGTTFTVSIPTGSAHLPPDRTGGERTLSSTSLAPDLYVEEAQRWLPDTQQPKAALLGLMDGANAAPAVSHLTDNDSRPRILLADDNADMREYVRRLLSQRFEVDSVPDGAAALEAARHRPPDLVLSDVMMPRLDGFGLLRELRADTRTRTIPVILLSARAGEEARVEGLGQGADDYLVKPFSARELLARVDSHLGLARLRRETEERITTVLESITDGFLTLDRDWHFVYVNAEAERLNGMSRHEMLGKSHWEVFPATLGTKVEQEFRRAVTEQVRVEFENYYEPWQRWFAVRAYPVKDGGLAVYFQDITESKQTRDRLRESEERFRAIVSQVAGGIAMTDWEGHFLFVNQKYCEIVGRPADALLRLRMKDITHPDDLPRNLPLFEKLEREGTEFLIETRYVRPDGSHVWVRNNVSRLSGGNGEPKCVLAVVVDMTERRRAEEALRRYADQLQDLAAAAARFSVATDVDSALRVVTEEARDLIGAHQSFTRLTTDHHWAHAAAFSDKYAAWRDYQGPSDGSGLATLVSQLNKTVRMTQEELERHPVWKDFENEIAKHPPMRGWLAAPLSGRDGRNLGLIQLSDKDAGEFTEDDEAILVQLARMASVAVENARLYDQLREADRRKDEFLATLAHELRNPLAPIRNSVQIMRLAGGNKEVAEQARQTIERQLTQMVRLVDDLLDVSRISRNKIELRKERVALSSIVQSAIETSRPLIEASDHELSVTLPPQTVWLNADLTRMAQVVANLLNNAAKYTPEHGHIWLTAERQGNDAVIRVRDTGIGIPHKMLPHIFEMFTQVDTARDRAQGGLGIGLTLVKSLVEMHGGSVRAASAGPGQGTEFTVRLPVAPEEQAARGARNEGEGEPRTKLPTRRILVVDDNRDSAESLGMLLTMMGNEVRTVHDGRAALEEVRTFRPDLALLDIGMPGMSGYELARGLREQPELRGVVLVAVTGWGQEEDRRRSQEAGFDHHLTKPADLAALEKLLAGMQATTGS